MEESEKRRERLKAMRLEASQPDVDNVVGDPAVPHHLSNPLVETSPIPALQNNSSAPPRFDYYTDPMAAFSADKRRSKVSNQSSRDCFTPPRPMNPEMTPSPVYQVQPNYSPDQRMYQPRGPYHSSGPMSPSPTHQSQTNYSPDQRMYRAQGHYQSTRPYGSPIGMVSPSGSHQGSSGTSSYYHPPNSSEGGNFSSPRFGGGPRFRSPTSGLGFGGSPSSYSGRGRSSGRGRGFGSHGSVSAELRPDLYYNKSMVEDPWKLLKPVIWKKEIISATSEKISMVDYAKSSFPKSDGIKKPRISGGLNESSSSSQPSLAEYLAAAFNEAADDGANK